MLTKQDLINFELKVKDLWEAGKIKAPVHLSGGSEDALIEIFKEISPHDYCLSTHRNHYHALLHGVDPAKLMSEIQGLSSGTCGGHARSMGFIDHSRHFYSSAIVGGMCNIAVGLGWALKRQQSGDALAADEHGQRPRHVWCFVGDSVVDGGHFWEALGYVEGWNLPVKFVVEFNDRATCTSWDDRNGPLRRCLGRIQQSPKCIFYEYKADFCHVGSGKYVQF